MTAETKSASDARKAPPNAARTRGRPVKGSETVVTQEIIRAARTLFFDNGYEATSTDEVAALAQCSKRTMYTRFATKADLFEAVVLDFIEERRSAAEWDELSELDLRDQLIRLAEKTVDAFMRSDVRSLYFVIHREAARFPELVRIAEEAGRKPSVARLVKILEDGGVVGDHHFLAEQYFALIHAPLIRHVVGGHTEITDELFAYARRSVEFFIVGCGKAVAGNRAS